MFLCFLVRCLGDKPKQLVAGITEISCFSLPLIAGGVLISMLLIILLTVHLVACLDVLESKLVGHRRLLMEKNVRYKEINETHKP